jgi:hypothetical protein
MSAALVLRRALAVGVFCAAPAVGCTLVVGDGQYEVGGDAGTDAAMAAALDTGALPQPDTGGGGPTCTPKTGASECSKCQDTSCCAVLTTCAQNAECVALVKCEGNCGDSSCIADCQTQHAAGKADLAAYSSCVSGSCPVCSQEGVGDPCTADSDCPSPLTCSGLWCTKSCAGDPDCAGAFDNGQNRYSGTNTCAVNKLKAAICFPACTSDADCAPYAGTTCVSDPTPNNGVTHICATHPVAADGGVVADARVDGD